MLDTLGSHTHTHTHKKKIPAIVPKLSRTPGSTNWAGPELGEHTQEILEGILQMLPHDIEKLKKSGVL